MAIIKRTPRPGQLIRGAKTDNVAAIDKDGNIIGTSIPYDKVMIDPVGGQVGDVLTKRNGGGYSWQSAEDGRIKNVTNKFSYSADMESWLDANEDYIDKVQYDAIQIGPFVLFSFLISVNDVTSSLPYRIFDIDSDLMDEYSYKILPAGVGPITPSTTTGDYKKRQYFNGIKYYNEDYPDDEPSGVFNCSLSFDNENNAGIYVYGYDRQSQSVVRYQVVLDSEKCSGFVTFVVGGSV